MGLCKCCLRTDRKTFPLDSIYEYILELITVKKKNFGKTKPLDACACSWCISFLKKVQLFRETCLKSNSFLKKHSTEVDEEKPIIFLSHRQDFANIPKFTELSFSNTLCMDFEINTEYQTSHVNIAAYIRDENIPKNFMENMIILNDSKEEFCDSNDEFYEDDKFDQSHDALSFDIDIAETAVKIEVDEPKFLEDYENKRNSEAKPFKISGRRKQLNKIKMKKVACFKCGYLCSSNVKSNNFNQKSLKCSECNFECVVKKKMIRHTLFHTKNKAFSCFVCGFKCKQTQFNEDKSLIPHKREVKLFNCTKCKYSSSSKSYLKIHDRTHTGEKPFYCDQCSYVCANKKYLKNHMLTHTKEKKFACPECPYKCARKHSYQNHLMTHSGEKPFSCTECNYKSVRKTHLQTHMLKHSGEKPFHCSKCSFSCTRNNDLKIHQLTHTGIKAFKCTLCSYSSKVKRSLNIHMFKHTGERQFVCSCCSYSCTTKVCLKSHMMTHSGEKSLLCAQCGFTCAHVTTLNSHMLTHSTEKPLSCSICSYSCSQKQHLKRHILIHERVKPLKCPQCDYSCIRKHSLTSHMRTHIK